MESETLFYVSISDCLWHPFIVTTTTIFTKISETTFPDVMMSAHTIMRELITWPVSLLSVHRPEINKKQ